MKNNFSIYILFEENRLISRDKWWESGGKTFVEHFLARKRKHQFDISNPRVLFMKLDSFLPLLFNCRKKKKNLGLRLISSLLSISSSKRYEFKTSENERLVKWRHWYSMKKYFITSGQGCLKVTLDKTPVLLIGTQLKTTLDITPVLLIGTEFKT